MMRLITITDGSSSVAITLQVFFYSVLESGAFKTFDEIILLTPLYSPQDQIDKLVSVFKELNINKISMRFTNPYNRYYAKLMLREYIAVNSLSSDAVICYLDYDHIFRKPINIKPTLDVSAIYVSSEVWPITSALIDDNLGVFRDHQLPPVHYNTSLIIGKTNVLHMAVESWHEKYIQYAGIVSPRYLEEVAFSMSVLSHYIDIFQIPSTVQGNWQQTNKECQVFHYGTESKHARKLKRDIPIILGQDISLTSRDASLAVVRNIEELINKSISD